MGSRAAAVALTALLAGGCYFEKTGAAAGSLEALAGETCRLGLQLPTGKLDPTTGLIESGVSSRDGLWAPGQLRGTVRDLAGGLVQVETGKAMLWIPLEQVLFIEREK